MAPLRLGVNIDHVATLRNARGGAVPDPVRAALIAIEAGADGITAHLREDRRHIRDDDMARLKRQIARPLNFEMAATEQMLDIALRHPAPRLLPGPGKAHRAHHRGRPRRDRRPRPSQAFRRRTHARRHPRLAVRRTLRRGARGLGLARRAGGRAAHRRLVRRRREGRGGARGGRIRAAARGRGADARTRPRMPRRPRPRLRHRADHRRAAGDRRTQHRPFHRRRGDLHRSRAQREGDARSRWTRAAAMPADSP